MQRNRIGTIVLIAAIAGCSPQDHLKPAPQPLPYIAIEKPSPPGQTRIMLTARIRGRFVIDDECVRIKAGKSLFTPIFYDGTRIDRDTEGLFVQDAETAIRFRNGDRFVGGGGEMPADHLKELRLASSPIPQACQGKMGTINPGLQRAQR
ncbi:hypothetical protein [Novosphingobium malaysiense]|uniref:Lipoprotein n=1 Tax=Novosphingobium malaysiense TaxID=1348853 RepID=A0A0B1ZRG4_9SPHN|nr:hypothetical protein [Novosphingobium malaysiense]KHK93151.1 hypothetical protein LK12_02065 [Novosphingobium malaysiense]